jgi:hypothetical protein
MGIVASSAGEPRISVAPAFAALEPVGLRLGGIYAFGARLFDVPPCAMTGTAEINRVDRDQPSGIENSCLSRRLACPRHCGLFGRDVFTARSMASFAGYARNQIFFVELLANG